MEIFYRNLFSLFSAASSNVIEDGWENKTNV